MTAKESQDGGAAVERFAIRFPVELQIEGQSEVALLHTWGVFREGISLRSEEVIKVGQSVHVKMSLPSGIGILCLKGTVDYCSVGDSPIFGEDGIGLRWAAGQDEALVRWNEFIFVIGATLTEQTTALNVGFEGAESKGVKLSAETREARKFERYAARLLVTFGSIDGLEECIVSEKPADAEAKDVSAGGMFLVTTESFMVGDLVEIRALHPDSDISFVLRAAIRWRGQKGSDFGVGVEFLKQDDGEVIAFRNFLDNHIVKEEALD